MQTLPVTVTNAVTHAEPYPFYARLTAKRPFDFDESAGLWVGASAAAVTAVLSDSACRVRPAAEPVPRGIVGTPAGEVFGGMVRMTDGEPHARLKQVLLDALGTVDQARVHQLAADRAREVLAQGKEPWEELMFGVPARVVATLCDLDQIGSVEATRLIGAFVRCIPASATAEDHAAAAEAAGRLRDLLGRKLRAGGGGLLGELVRAAAQAERHETTALVANGVGLLSQTYEATAGLIGNSVLALAREPQPDDLTAFIGEVARHDAPIQNTRRFTAEPFRFGDQDIPPGSAILLLLAAANRDPAVNPDPEVFCVDRREPIMFTFGWGAHHCPGRGLAVAITSGVLRALLDNGPLIAASDTYRQSPNARIPILRTA